MALPSAALRRIPKQLRTVRQQPSVEHVGGGDMTQEAESSRAQAAADQSFMKRKHEEARLRGKEPDRIGKWNRMMSGTDDAKQVFASQISPRKLRRRVFKGIPDRWRVAAWEALIARRAEATSAKKREDHLFISSLSAPSTHDVQIDLDVPRTISGHILFHTRYGLGQRNLFRVLHAFSLLCDDCAYCQGMGPIAATLLCYMVPETAFRSMAGLHDAYSLHKIFTPGFPGLVELFFLQKALMTAFVPRLLFKLEDQMINTSSYATKWYITLFNGIVPFQTQLRIWDAFLLEGPDVLVITSLAILWSLQDTLLDPQQGSFEHTLGTLSSYMIPESDDVLLHWIDSTLSKRSTRATLIAARAEWHSLEASGKTAGLAL